MGGLKLTFKLGPKKPASDGGEGGSGGSAPSAPPRALPSGPGGGAPHPFAAGARTGGGDAGASPSGARPKVPAALLKAKLERERAAAGAASLSAGGAPSEGATMKGVPKALLMKGVPKALQGGGKPAPGVSSGKVEKKKVKRPIPAGAGSVPGLPGVKIRLVSKPGGGLGAAAAAAAAAAAMDSGYDSWGEGDDATPTASALGTNKRARDAAASDDHSRGTAATESGLVPGPVPAFAEPPPKPAAMYDVVKKLQAKDKHGVFAEPVTEAIAPGYFSVVSTPMDFRTLRENVRLGKYQSWDAFVQDVELIFANAMAYNPAGTAVHALAAKTLEHARRAAEKARNAGLSPGARAKRAKMAHVASMASFGGDERSAFSMGANGVSNIVSMDDPSQSRGVGAPSSTGFEEEEDDDDEVGGGNDEDDKKKKKELRFKRHTFAELTSRAAMPSLAAWRRAGEAKALSDGTGASCIPETPQTMVRPSATFFQKRVAAESYAGSLSSWGAALRGRARVVALRLARAASSLIPPPPPRAPSPPPREEDEPAEEDEPVASAFGAENDDGSESDDDSPLISIAAKVRGAQVARVAPILPAANAQKSLALAAAAAAASQRASASVKTAGLISRGQVAPESRGDPLPALRAQLGLPPDGGFADVVRGVHADLSRGLGAVRDRLRGVGFGKDHPIVPAPPPLPATRRRT